MPSHPPTEEVAARAGNGKATDAQTSKLRDELGDRLVQESDAIQRAAAKLTASAKELTKSVARHETKVTDASRVAATAKGEATKAEKYHRRIESLELAIGSRGLALLERIEQLESTIGRIDRNTRKGFGKERG